MASCRWPWPADGTLTGAFNADKDGFYRFELDAPTGERVTASPQYTIDVLTDQPPTVSIAKPGRDTSASPIEEVFVEARAEDDFGVRDLELVYSVNGAAEKTVRLFDGKNRLAGGHRRPHVLSRGARASSPATSCRTTRAPADNDAVRRPSRRRATSTSCRSGRCSKDFKRAESDAGGGGGGGGGGRPGRRALAAAAADHRRDVQRQPRSQDDDGRQAARELDRGRAVAGEAARAGRRAADAHEQPPGRAGSRVQEDRGAAAAGGHRDEERGGQAAEGRSAGRARAGAEGAADPAEGGRGIRSPGADGPPAAAAVAAAGRAPWPRISPICSSSSSTRWPTSTRPRSGRSSSRPIRRSTSCWRS